MTRSSRRRDILRNNERFLRHRIEFLNSEIRKARNKAKLYHGYARPRQPQEKGWGEIIGEGITIDPLKSQMGPLFVRAIDQAQAEEYEERARKLEKRLDARKARLVEIQDEIRREQQQSYLVQVLPDWLQKYVKENEQSFGNFGNQSISHRSAWPVDIDDDHDVNYDYNDYNQNVNPNINADYDFDPGCSNPGINNFPFKP